MLPSRHGRTKKVLLPLKMSHARGQNLHITTYAEPAYGRIVLDLIVVKQQNSWTSEPWWWRPQSLPKQPKDGVRLLINKNLHSRRNKLRRLDILCRRYPCGLLLNFLFPKGLRIPTRPHTAQNRLQQNRPLALQTSPHPRIRTKQHAAMCHMY